MKLSFKQFVEADQKRQREGRIKMLIYGQNFIFFFRYEDDIYGGSEEARLTFASMKKNKSEDMVFGATNLTSSLKGEPGEEFFRPEDIDKIAILNSKSAEISLLGQQHYPDKDFHSKISDVSNNRRQREKDQVYGLHKIDKDVE
jgi:hypothetical protein